MSIIRAVDLCCGVGGWACAARGLPIEFVAVADVAADCLETWRVNHLDDHPQCQLLEVDLSSAEGVAAVRDAAEKVDLLLGGIPCEQVSPLRGSLPVDDEKMKSWYRLLDNCLGLVDRVAPRWWCFEDVIQIEKHLPLPLWHGREIPRQRIDAAEYGPQRRKRSYLGEFPRPTPGEPQTLKSCLLPGPHVTIPHAEEYTENPTNRAKVWRDFIRLLDPEQPCPTITTSFATRGGRQRRSFIVEDSRGRRRVLSWQEAALVQGFPTDFLFVGGYTRSMEMIGRAIPIQVGRAILRAICDQGERGDKVKEVTHA